MKRGWYEVCTAGDLAVRGAATWPGADAIVFPEARASWTELLARGVEAARSLVGLGVQPGERVGILMPNCMDFVEVLLGGWLVGATVVPVNARFKARELGHVVEDADLVLLAVTDLAAEYADFVPLVAEAVAQRPPPLLRHLVMLGSTSPAGYLDRAAFAAAGEGVEEAEVDRRRRAVRLRQPALMMYTSGTTANPKGCPLSHEALVRTGIATAERLGVTAGDRFWDPLPMFHMGGLLLMTACLHAGAAYLTMTRFSAGAALQQMERERCTWAYPTFPTITQDLVHHPDFARTDLSRVRALLDTGARESLIGVQRSFPQAAVVTSYGMTELGGVCVFGDPDDDLETRVGAGGRPLPGMSVRAVDPTTGTDAAPGVAGELWVRGPGLFEGYHKDPGRTAEAIDAAGWFHTGDLGTVDGRGYVTYQGRLKDMLKVGGENVAAVELEAFLMTHPAVKIAQVVGIPDPRLIEVPAAFVELVAGRSLTEAELIAWCRGKIASFKVPRRVSFVTEWPMSATKIQKFRLRERLLAELGSDVGAPA